MTEISTIAIVGGAGQLGSGLAYRLAKAGHPLILASRTAERAEEAVTALKDRVPAAAVRGADYAAASAEAALTILAVPFAAQRAALDAVKSGVEGKILIDATVALIPPKVGTVQLPPEGCAGVIAQQVLGDGVKVVSAFQNVPAKGLSEDGEVECDVLVCGNDRDACRTVVELANSIGLRAFDAGNIQNAAAAEALTSVLISLGRRYKAHPAIRLTGL